MRWFMDCEFAENGQIIDLISIALVAEDGPLCQLYGSMANLPRAFGQQWCWDLKQHMETLGVPRNKLPLQTDEHDALADARWVRKAFLTVQALHPDVVPGRAAPVMVERVIEERQSGPVEADAATPLDAAQWLLGMHNGNPLARDAAPRPPHTDFLPVKCACESCTSCRALAMADPAQWLASEALERQFGDGVARLAQALGIQAGAASAGKFQCKCGRALDPAVPPNARFICGTGGHVIGCPDATRDCLSSATHEGPTLEAQGSAVVGEPGAAPTPVGFMYITDVRPEARTTHEGPMLEEGRRALVEAVVKAQRRVAIHTVGDSGAAASRSTSGQRAEPRIWSHITDVLPETHPLARKNVGCDTCGHPVHAFNNECMSTWVETGKGNFCLPCFSKAIEPALHVLEDEWGIPQAGSPE